LDLIVTVFFNVCSPPVFKHHLPDLLPFFAGTHTVRPEFDVVFCGRTLFAPAI
jgi:hypothetical protein